MPAPWCHPELTPPELMERPWQPVTFRGVARFAQAPWGCLFRTGFGVALVVAVAVVWFLHWAWVPVLQQAIRQLPDQAEIHNGQLLWSAPSPLRLAENPYLTLAVDWEGTGALGQGSDVQVVLGRFGWRLEGILGSWRFSYPTGWIMAMSRAEIEPWWGAWKPQVLALICMAVMIGLWISWALLALIYAPILRMAAFFFHRRITPAGSRRLAGAALMPGALVCAAGLVGYGLRQLGPLDLLVIFGLHWVMGWLYALLALVWLPSFPKACAPSLAPPPDPANPFQAARSTLEAPARLAEPDVEPSAPKPRLGPPANPFHGP